MPSWHRLVDDKTSEDGSTGISSSEILGRLAETDHSPDISNEARIIINSMRLHGVRKEDDRCETSLEAYSDRTSKCNLVLIGTRDKEAPSQQSAACVNEEVFEEDWSHIMTSELSGGFAQHEVKAFRLSDNSEIQIACAPSLTPLDMIDLSWGTHDATGHCVWTGARFLIQILTPILQSYFTNKKILELGSGTGLAGIAIATLFSLEELLLTDSSTSALELCRHNCSINNVLNANVQALTWGASISSTMFDTVFAADVLYDIQAWEPLLRTAYLSLRESGIFILSHVPRAALPEDSLYDSLESYLTSVAGQHHFSLIRTLRPHDFITTVDAWKEMEQGGTAVFVFQKDA